MVDPHDLTILLLRALLLTAPLPFTHHLLFLLHCLHTHTFCTHHHLFLLFCTLFVHFLGGDWEMPGSWEHSITSLLSHLISLYVSSPLFCLFLLSSLLSSLYIYVSNKPVSPASLSKYLHTGGSCVTLAHVCSSIPSKHVWLHALHTAAGTAHACLPSLWHGWRDRILPLVFALRMALFLCCVKAM